jgi:hypothetical protein
VKEAFFLKGNGVRVKPKQVRENPCADLPEKDAGWRNPDADLREKDTGWRNPDAVWRNPDSGPEKQNAL